MVPSKNTSEILGLPEILIVLWVIAVSALFSQHERVNSNISYDGVDYQSLLATIYRCEVMCPSRSFERSGFLLFYYGEDP